jgi:low affinity Fe/Cu permease
MEEKERETGWQIVSNIAVAILIIVLYCTLQSKINYLEQRVEVLEQAEEQRILSDLEKINNDLDYIHEKLKQRGGL